MRLIVKLVFDKWLNNWVCFFNQRYDLM